MTTKKTTIGVAVQLYPAKIRPDGSGFVATFRDIPEARTWAGSKEQVILMAQDALMTAFDFYLETNRPVPPPSKAKLREVLIDVPATVAAKVLLLNEMRASKVGPAEMAIRLRTSLQAVNRIINLRSPTKIDRIDDALGVLGKRLALTAV